MYLISPGKGKEARSPSPPPPLHPWVKVNLGKMVTINEKTVSLNSVQITIYHEHGDENETNTIGD